MLKEGSYYMLWGVYCMGVNFWGVLGGVLGFSAHVIESFKEYSVPEEAISGSSVTTAKMNQKFKVTIVFCTQH